MSELVNSRFGTPSLPPGYVARPRLITSLDSAQTHPVTLLSAPLGYGKTVLLAEWAHAQNASQTFPCFAWVSLHESCDDPHRFWQHVERAFDSIAAIAREPGLSTRAFLQASSAQGLLTALRHGFSGHTRPIVLVLDDYHLIGADAIQAGVEFIVDHLPPHLHLVIASQADPPLPLARWRVRGQLFELRTDDLRFTREEARAFLARYMTLIHALPRQREEIAALETQSEGWIAGLQLAAIALQGRGQASPSMTAFAGSQDFSVDGLAGQILQRQPPALSSFLLQTSILDRLCGSLCDAVTGAQNGQEMLETLEQADLFITRLGDEGHWYQFHRLFADILRNRLFHTHHDQLLTLHRRASEWYSQHAMPEEAIRHALAANDHRRAERLIGQAAPELLQRGETGILLAWLAALPEAVLRQASSLCILHARALSASGQREAARRRLAEAESAPDCGPDRLAEIDVLRSGLYP